MNNNETVTKNNKIDWEQVMKDYDLEKDPNEFVQQLFTMTTSLLALQLDKKETSEIAVEMGEFELILKRAKKIQKEYKH